jgi:hypothetical protein
MYVFQKDQTSLSDLLEKNYIYLLHKFITGLGGEKTLKKHTYMYVFQKDQTSLSDLLEKNYISFINS